MQMSASPLAFLAAATPGGKLTTPSSGGDAHRAGKAGAEARLSSEQADSADMPEEASSFSRMLRDLTANARPDEARAAARPGKKGAESKSDTTSEPAGDTEVLVVVAERAKGHEGVDPAEVAAAVRAQLGSRHGVALHELVLVDPGAVPRTSSGKVARSASRDLYLAKTWS